LTLKDSASRRVVNLVASDGTSKEFYENLSTNYKFNYIYFSRFWFYCGKVDIRAKFPYAINLKRTPTYSVLYYDYRHKAFLNNWQSNVKKLIN